MSISTFLNLPDDVLFGILSCLDCESILTMRLTCKEFNFITRHRQVWLSQIRSIETMPGGSKPEESVYNDYTVKELEEWVTRRLRSSGQLGSLAPLKYGVRYIKGHTSSPLLLPGGRWLLHQIDTPMLWGGSNARRIFVTDLDQEQPKPKVLIDLDIPTLNGATKFQEALTYQRLAYWVEDTERLSIRLLVYDMLDNGAREPHMWIYRLTLVGHGLRAMLQAKLLKTITVSVPLLKSYQMTLNDKYMIRARMELDEPQDVYMDIFSNYMGYKTTEKVMPITVKLDWKSIIPNPVILPGDRVLFVCKHALLVYAIPLKNYLGNLQPTQQISGLNIERGYGLSKGYITPNGDCHYTMQTRFRHYTLHIPRNLSQAPTLHKIEPEPGHLCSKQYGTIGTGCSQSYFIHEEGVTRITYSVDSLEKPRYTATFHKYYDPGDIMEDVEGSLDSQDYGVDEISGRILLVHGRDHFVILDPVKPSIAGSD